MNTIRSVWYGWGVLVAAGGGAYYFAKRSINSDRAERAEVEHKRRAMNKRMEQEALYKRPEIEAAPRQKNRVTGDRAPADDPAASPSSEAQVDPAPTRHAPENVGQKAVEKSKYESAEPLRSRKGDRFSGV